MKTIVYLDGSIESTANHAAIVARGDARYATTSEEAAYEIGLEFDDAFMRMSQDS